VPQTKSCKKRLLTSKKRNLRNRENRAAMRSAVKVYRNNVEGFGEEEKIQGLKDMYALMDSQAKKGLMPKKRAARLKSRLAALTAK